MIVSKYDKNQNKAPKNKDLDKISEVSDENEKYI
jgi:hypothetical protein